LEQNATIKVIHFDRPYYPVILELSSTSDNRGQGDDQSGSISAYQRTVCSERAVATRNCPKTWDFSEYGKEILPGRVSTIREINTATQAFCYDPGSRRVHSTVFEADEEAPSKQRHTAKRIYDRLVEEKGFTGGESTVRQYVRKLKNKSAEAFVPLEFDPGEAMQVDWGEATVLMGGKKTTVHVFCARLCFSAMPFVIAFPFERLEALLEGHIEAFKFFNGVPQRAIYDNVRTIVKEGWGKHVASEQKDFVQLKAHYAFKSTFCNPGQANEKGLVENLVGWSRNNIFVPVPRVNSLQELNDLLRKRCLNYQSHTIRGRSRSVGQEFEIEKSRLTALPKRHMEPIRQVIAKVNHFATVRFERNRYSVPVNYVGSDVTVKASVFEVFCMAPRATDSFTPSPL